MPVDAQAWLHMANEHAGESIQVSLKSGARASGDVDVIEVMVDPAQAHVPLIVLRRAPILVDAGINQWRLGSLTYVDPEEVATMTFDVAPTDEELAAEGDRPAAPSPDPAPPPVS